MQRLAGFQEASCQLGSGFSTRDHHISVCNHLVSSVFPLSEEMVNGTTFENAKAKMLSGGK